MPKKRELTEEEEALRERLGAALRQASAARGIRPQELALVGGVSVAHQYRIESGETTPDALYLFKVCHLMGVTMDSLFRGAAELADNAPSAGMPSPSSAAPAPKKTVNKGVQAGHIGGSVTITTNKGSKR